jgi:mannose-6-phosphate isomerase-like protein (cupin superfamily)
MSSPKKFNLSNLLAGHPPRTNFHVLRVDRGYTVRVAKTIGRFPWHCHPNGDEGWLVFKGRLRIDTQAGPVELGRGDFTVIPRGLRHSPRALIPGTVVVVFHKRGLGMRLDDPNANLGGFKEYDLTKKSS